LIFAACHCHTDAADIVFIFAQRYGAGASARWLILTSTPPPLIADLRDERAAPRALIDISLRFRH